MEGREAWEEGRRGLSKYVGSCGFCSRCLYFEAKCGFSPTAFRLNRYTFFFFRQHSFVIEYICLICFIF